MQLKTIYIVCIIPRIKFWGPIQPFDPVLFILSTSSCFQYLFHFECIVLVHIYFLKFGLIECSLDLLVQIIIHPIQRQSSSQKSFCDHKNLSRPLLIVFSREDVPKVTYSHFVSNSKSEWFPDVFDLANKGCLFRPVHFPPQIGLLRFVHFIGYHANGSMKGCVVVSGKVL